jgi:hypothetical protein
VRRIAREALFVHIRASQETKDDTSIGDDAHVSDVPATEVDAATNELDGRRRREEATQQ